LNAEYLDSYDQTGEAALNIQIEDMSRRGEGEVERLAMRIAAMDPWLRLGYSKESISVYLRNPEPDAGRLAIVVNDAVAGILCLRYPWLRGVYIEMFALIPEVQGMGVGSRMLEYIEGEFQSKTRNIWLLVSAFNGKAQGFYRAKGFLQIGKIKDFLVEGEDEILMRKTIQPIKP